MTPPTAPLLHTVLDGKFQIERALASGAGGDVYEATHLTLGSRVAVKVLRDGAQETAAARRKRFLREARLAAGIQSEHVVRVFDFAAEETGPAYIVMELLQGETLADRVRRQGPLPIAEAVEYVVQAATPLAPLHERSIVHRDVKPSNLFLAKDSDGRERVKLLDFGVAVFRPPVAREEGSWASGRALVGTPRYMAPEQVRASSLVDARADVWALGVTLYELLAGRPPFDAQNVLAVMKQIERAAPEPLRTARPDVPAALASIVHACLQRDPKRRPQNARALVDALTRVRVVDVPEAGASVGDTLDLSLHDPDVDELRPARAVRAQRAAIVVAIAIVGIGALALRARSAPETTRAGAHHAKEIAARSIEEARDAWVAPAPSDLTPPASSPAPREAMRATRHAVHSRVAPKAARPAPADDEPLE